MKYLIILSLIFAFPIFTSAKPLALVTNGGVNVFSNHGRYYRNLKSAANTFSKNWQVWNLSADGPDSQSFNSVNSDEFDHMIFDTNGLPVLSRFVPESNFVGPASYSSLVKTLSIALPHVQPGEPVALYFTDHGSQGRGPEDRQVCLWGENINVSQLRSLIDLVPTTSKVILIHDQCFGGGMLEALWKDGKLKSNACGFAAATSAELAFGGGGLMSAIESHCLTSQKLGRECNFQDVYQSVIKNGNWDRESTPISSSDLYLQKFLKSRTQISSDGVVICEDHSTRLPGFDPYISLYPLLESRLNQIQENLHSELGVLKNYFPNVLNVCQNLSSQLILNLEQKINQEEALLAQMKDKLNNDLKPALKTLIIDEWLREKGNPKLYLSYKNAKAELTDLNNQLKNSDSQIVTSETLAKIKALKLRSKPIEDQINLYMVAVKDSGKNSPLAKDFHNYLKFKCKETRSACANLITLNQYEEAEMNVFLQIKKLVPAWRLYRDLNVAFGIQSLLKVGSESDITQYLNLLQCERTSI